MKLILGLFFCVLAVYGAFEGYKYWQENQRQERTEQLARQVADFCLKNKSPKSKTDEIEIMRSCIHNNTQHVVDDEFRRNWRESDKMASLALDYMQGRSTKKPHFECSTRSSLLREALNHRGIKSKHVTVIKDDKAYSDHVMLEVLNPDTGREQIEDASYDVSFVLVSNKKETADLKDFLKPDVVLPCRAGKCSWNLKMADIGDVKDLKDFPAAYRRETPKEKSQLFYDTGRFDPDAANDSGRSYCEQKKKWCHNLVKIH